MGFQGLIGYGGGSTGLSMNSDSGPAPYYDDTDPFSDSSQVGYWKLISATTPNQNSTGNTCSALDGTPAFTDIGYSKYWNNPASSSINTNHNPRDAYPVSFSIWCYKPTGDWSSGDQNQLLVNWSVGGQRLSICCVDWNNDGSNWDWSIMYGGTGHWLFAPTSRPENQWMHMVYSVAGNNSSSSKLYQNGTAISGSNQGGSHGGSSGTTIGGNSAGSEDFNGWIYNVRVFNKQLSQSEAADLYANDKPPGA